MSTVKQGDTVSVHYTGKLDDGSVFDSSSGRDPLQFTVGQQRVIPGFENALIGMEPGETKTAEVSADAAYGPRNPELVLDFQREQIPQELDPQVGQSLQLQTQDGQSVAARVVGVSDGGITVDANHPLAGKDLTFDIELVEIVGQA